MECSNQPFPSLPFSSQVYLTNIISHFRDSPWYH